MIHHIVALRLAALDPAEHDRLAHEAIARLEALRDLSAGVLALDVHPDLGDAPGHWSLVLVSRFDTLASLDHYQHHPRHRAVLDWLNDGVVAERAVVDYVTP